MITTKKMIEREERKPKDGNYKSGQRKRKLRERRKKEEPEC